MVNGALLEPLERLGFADVLLWLLSFAIVYGVLQQAEIPKLRSVRAIIGIVVAFFVLLTAPGQVITTLSSLSTSLFVVLLGILTVFVFLEIAGVKHLHPSKMGKRKIGGQDVEVVEEYSHAPMFTKHTKLWASALILATIVLFIGAGGLDLVGLSLPTGVDPLGAATLAMIALAVMWLVIGKD